MVNGGRSTFPVSELARSGDPANGAVKTLAVNYTINGRALTATGMDMETISLTDDTAAVRVADLRLASDNQLFLKAWSSGTYVIQTAAGKTMKTTVKNIPPPLKITGP